MRRNSIPFTALTIGLCLVGCGSADAPAVFGSGGSQDLGGYGAATGGARPTGGNVQTLGGAYAGETNVGGNRSSVGGASQASSPTGGSANTGGLATTGGRDATGGTVATTGGHASGGNPATGGKATGGIAATGGAAPGGTSGVGGVTSTGSVSATGGKAAGGASQTGGTPASGGGSVTGGMPAVGGASALPKFVGNIDTNRSIDSGGMKYSNYWDQITPENAGKWGSVQANASGAFNWSTLDAIYAHAVTDGIIFKEHVFVWGAGQPSGPPTQAQVENWIKSFCARYPNTKLIDVVSEPPPHTTPTYAANLGVGETGSWPWITKAFKLARQYCGDAVLILNDYNNIEYADQETHFIEIVKDIKANGAPIDAVGCQAHSLKGRTAASVQANIDTMATGTGLPIYITEYDIGDNDQVQLTNFQTHMPVFLNTASVKGITVWGWINGSTWITNSGLVNGTTPRPAMTWLMEQLKRPVPPN